jgi:hypothetical protein
MKKVVIISGILWSIILSMGCSKSGNSSGTTTAFNGYRTKGFAPYPATTAWVWNDTLSNAAFKFATDIAAQGDGPGGNMYETAKGVDIFVYAMVSGYTGAATNALLFPFPDNSTVQSMVDAAFNQNTPGFVSAIMAPTVHEFGMGVFNNRWYLLAGHH